MIGGTPTQEVTKYPHFLGPFLGSESLLRARDLWRVDARHGASGHGKGSKHSKEILSEMAMEIIFFKKNMIWIYIVLYGFLMFDMMFCI